MGIRNVQFIECDRCGKSVETDGKLLGASPLCMSESYPDWAVLPPERLLCPACREGYDLLLARHKVEIEDYIANPAR